MAENQKATAWVCWVIIKQLSTLKGAQLWPKKSNTQTLVRSHNFA
jgi:hypothetical protein